MKLGLLDLLACPICKYWPIKLYIFNWETSEEKFNKILNGINDIKLLQDMTKIVREKNKIDNCVNLENDTIQDDLVRYKLNFNDYLKKAIEILNNLNYIELKCEGPSKSAHELVKKIYSEFKKMVNTPHQEKLKAFIESQLNNIYFINWYFQRAEVEDGIMTCEKCKRWYPISNSIPQMLPDNLRVEKDEKRFLEKWKLANKVPEEILNEGKPFNLKSK